MNLLMLFNLFFIPTLFLYRKTVSKTLSSITPNSKIIVGFVVIVVLVVVLVVNVV